MLADASPTVTQLIVEDPQKTVAEVAIAISWKTYRRENYAQR
jgi:hypothetical protein